jgi:hypothetical protein
MDIDRIDQQRVIRIVGKGRLYQNDEDDAE